MLISSVLGFARHLSSRICPKTNNLRLYALAASKPTTGAPKSPNSEEYLDAPVKFSSSGARLWKAKSSRLGYTTERLWYEPYVILVSLSVFLIYFTLLREENDIDEELNKTLYSRIKGLEEFQLRMSLDYNRKHNLDTSKIIKRLKEIEEEKLQKTM